MSTERSQQDFRPGIYDTPEPEYHADPCPEPSLSAGSAVTVLQKSPLHAWWGSERLNPDFERVEKRHFDIGSAFHARITGVGGPVWRINAPDFRSKAAREERDEAYGAGYTPLLASDDDTVSAMVRACRVQMRAHGLSDPFEGGMNEMSIYWQQGGIWNRCRPDCIDPSSRRIFDLKTTTDAEPGAWFRTAINGDIDTRAAHYIDGAKSVYGGEQWDYIIIAIEKSPPHAISVLKMDRATLGMAQERIDRAREIWAHCVKTDEWPGYSRQIAVMEGPAWRDAKWVERRDRDRRFREENGYDFAATGIAVLENTP